MRFPTSGIIVAFVTLLLIFAIGARATQAVTQSDIIIDGNFSDWSNDTGDIHCQIDENGAKDVNHYIQYQFDDDVPIERITQYRDLNKQCVLDDQRNTLYLLQTVYRAYLVPFDWDLYDYQKICTLINTDTDRNVNFDYAVCTDVSISWCFGPNPACSEVDTRGAELYECSDLSESYCSDRRLMKRYNNVNFANGVGNEITFPVWVGSQLESFYDDMTEIALTYNELDAQVGDPICVNTYSYAYFSDGAVTDKVLNNPYCFVLGQNGTIPTPTNTPTPRPTNTPTPRPTNTPTPISPTATPQPASGLAELISPVSDFESDTVTFRWTDVNSTYYVYIGSNRGSAQYYSQGQGSNTSVTVSGLPTDGSTLYVRLWTNVPPWRYNDYEFTASESSGATATPLPTNTATPRPTNTPVPTSTAIPNPTATSTPSPSGIAELTSPQNGTTLQGNQATFEWTNVGANYYIYIGSTPGRANLYNGNMGSNTSFTYGLPTNGVSVIYVRLWTELNGWEYNDYVFYLYESRDSGLSLIDGIPIEQAGDGIEAPPPDQIEQGMTYSPEDTVIPSSVSLRSTDIQNRNSAVWMSIVSTALMALTFTLVLGRKYRIFK